MNKRDIELVLQAGLGKPYVSKTKCSSGVKINDVDALQRFADLIRADEREACAKIARKVANATRPDDFALDKCYEIEIAIRARGQA
jgi:hypothetical protein